MKPEPRHLLWHSNHEEGLGGGNFNHCSTTWFHRTLQMTTHKPELHFCSPVQTQSHNRAVVGLDLIWILSPIVGCFFAIWKWPPSKEKGKQNKTKKKHKKPRHLVSESSLFESVFPPFIYGTETEPHKWARGSCSIAHARCHRRGKINACQTLKTLTNVRALEYEIAHSVYLRRMSEFSETYPNVL